MEESNYYRELSLESEAEASSGADLSLDVHCADIKDLEKNILEKSMSYFSIPAAEGRPSNKDGEKSYWSKLKVFDTKALKYPNHLKGMMFRPLIFLTFPIIVYSGFSCGSNLI